MQQWNQTPPPEGWQPASPPPPPEGWQQAPPPPSPEEGTQIPPQYVRPEENPYLAYGAPYPPPYGAPQYPPQQPGAAYPPYPYEAPRPSRAFAVTALVLGILAVLLFQTGIPSILMAVLGVIFGSVAMYKKQGGLAIAGFVVSVVIAAFWVGVFFLSLLLVGFTRY
ncbi:MAG: DUF4190 domain-containing protein [Clostridia bacterium]|nr:DUF4190 domain-containing protein [Clostridia bacterium]